MNESGLFVFIRYLLAVLLPPVAVATIRGFGASLFVATLLTFLFPSMGFVYIWMRNMVDALCIFLCCCLILPGSAYAIWVTGDYYAAEDDGPPIIEPTPQRRASLYQQGGLPVNMLEVNVVSPLPGPVYAGKYSPMTQSSNISPTRQSSTISPYSSNY